MEVLLHERARLTPEHEEEEPERVEPGQERPRETDDPEDVAESPTVHRVGEYRVLREEAGERR
jgi:hypothetical protein